MISGYTTEGPSIFDIYQMQRYICLLLAMKGPRIADEIAELDRRWRVMAIHPLDVPGLDAERQLVVVSHAASP